LQKATISFIVSVQLSIRLCTLNISATTARILMKFDIWAFFENLWRKFKFN